jgi:hypothetical protein
LIGSHLLRQRVSIPQYNAAATIRSNNLQYSHGRSGRHALDLLCRPALTEKWPERPFGRKRQLAREQFL